jgi:hypothetical protein
MFTRGRGGCECRGRRSQDSAAFGVAEAAEPELVEDWLLIDSDPFARDNRSQIPSVAAGDFPLQYNPPLHRVHGRLASCRRPVLSNLQYSTTPAYICITAPATVRHFLSRPPFLSTPCPVQIMDSPVCSLHRRSDAGVWNLSYAPSVTYRSFSSFPVLRPCIRKITTGRRGAQYSESVRGLVRGFCHGRSREVTTNFCVLSQSLGHLFGVCWCHTVTVSMKPNSSPSSLPFRWSPHI